MEDYFNKLSLSGYQYIGDSSTAIPVMNIHAMYPDSPVVIIRRNKHDVAESLGRMFGDHDYLPFLEKIEGRLDQINGLEIAFEDIDDRLEEIWKHCINLPYDPIRTKILTNMKVEIMNLEFDQKTIEIFGGDLCLG
jgi:hypothetical protein